MRKLLLIAAIAIAAMAGCKKDKTPNPELSVIDKTLTFAAAGETKTFAVKSNSDWTISGHTNVSWIKTVSPASGKGDATISVTVDANPSAVETRSVDLTITTVGVTPQKVSISQGKLPSPEITSFSPTSAAYGATLTITGKNFSATSSENTVKLNGQTAVIISATAVEIKATVPKNMQCSGKISVTTAGATALSAADFDYLPTVTVSTLAGSGTAGYAEGAGDEAQFYGPLGVAVDASGNVYVADTYNHRIRKITPAGVVSTFAGNGTAGFVNGAGASAQFRNPNGMSFDDAGNLFVADNYNHCVRKITSAAVVSTFAGSGTAGFANGVGTAAQFNYTRDVAFDKAGNMYVADNYNNRIRKITPDGTVSVFAGSGTAGFDNGTGEGAQFNNPYSVTVDASGNVYVADYNNHLIRKITPAGVVTTVAGTNATYGFADGAGNAAKFYRPSGIVCDASGNLYVADYSNYRIRKITPDGMVTTIAGDGTAGFKDGAGGEAQFYNPWGIAIDASGNLYVADAYYCRIRKIMFE